MRKPDQARFLATPIRVTRSLSIGLLGLAPILLLQLAGQPLVRQSPAPSIWAEIYKSAWAGIYNKGQAARGEAAYREHCAFCHGASLEGTDDAPPLAGRDFRQDWDGANIADLFEKIQFTMP